MIIHRIFSCLFILSALSSCGDSTSPENKFIESLQKKWKWESTTRLSIAGGRTITPDSIKAHYTLDLTAAYSIRLLRNDTLQFSGHYSIMYVSNDKQWYLKIDSSSDADSLFPPLFETGTYIPSVSGKQLTFRLPDDGLSDYGGEAIFTSN